MTAPRRRRSTASADPTLVVGYVRVSTDEQALHGAGLDAQRAAIEAEAQRRGWTLVAIHADEGVSGRKGAEDRPGLTAALDDVREGRAATIVVSKLDRLYRNLLAGLTLLAQAEAEGWSAYALDGTVDMTTPTGRFQTRVMLSVAELERDQIAERTRAALAVKKAQGIRLGRRSALPSAVVARIVADRGSGKSLRAIAAELERDGIRTGQGGTQWRASSVKAVLDSQDAAALRDEAATA